MSDLIYERGWDKKIDLQKAMACLKDMAETYHKHGIKWWLMFGSLLGAVRDSGPIVWDDDIDIGVWQEDRNKIKLANEALRGKGFFIPETGEEGMPERDEVYIRDGQKIEAWVFKVDGDDAYYWEGQPNVRYPKSYFENLTTVPFGGMDCPVPKKSIDLVKTMYGETWRVPQMGYKCEQF